jgi:hypothetical protein
LRIGILNFKESLFENVSHKNIGSSKLKHQAGFKVSVSIFKSIKIALRFSLGSFEPFS